ncbi:beta-L-arabinofuranosidase domain-containing protein [Pseudoclavibacter sp. RFBB5]|uniref:beta-L-arabinofuranosidase domain-containing protein n=1 Tax=Pseudoclavibacter sp. RFBB5 TaxID=2080574 RepID=UPI000CE78E37|nr:beta-L-arabinofuranosidase domain-containing protein [Pseudoclavibacter sp. RFBB5]PPG33198.1 glycosyl hydrolase [Pseudoclavibacter sp. RFBB5]
MTSPTRAPRTERIAPPLVTPFGLGDVAIDDASVFARARNEMLHLADVYPIDRLLAVFRANAGIDTRGAAAPGTWEDFGHPLEEAWGEADYPGREHAQTANLLRGHYAGHFLSMLSMAYAGERAPALLAKVDACVAGLAEVQAVLAESGRYSHPGFLAAYGEWQFARLESYAPYGEIWAPYYTCHKIMAGLLDAHELAGSTLALEVVTSMGHWVHARLERLDPAQRQRMWSLYIAGEFGGMNETMARLSAAADEPAFLETASFFDTKALLDAGVAGDDILTKMHANQHLPQLVGYLHEFELTGERRYLDAVLGLWDQIVPGRMFAHGGTGESELWGPPQTVAGNIGQRNAETCATYNLLKIARLLFQHTLDPRFFDYSERAMLNHILGSRRAVDSDTSPEVTYMFPVHPGAVREYDNVGTCCGGTGLENHVKYQDSVFFSAGRELWVTLPTASTLHWREAGLRVQLSSGLPAVGELALSFAALPGGAPGAAQAESDELGASAVHIRIPSWVAGPVRLQLNGEPLEVEARPGTFATIRRGFTHGDVISLDLPMALVSAPTIDDPRLHHLQYGPTVLLARSEATTPLQLGLLGRRMLDGTLLEDAGVGDRAAGRLGERTGGGSVRFAGLDLDPSWSGADSRFHMYVRAADSTIAFAGRDSGVPNRADSSGETFLEALWGLAPFADRPAFLEAVFEAVKSTRSKGLLSGAELEAVLQTAGEADLAGDGRCRVSTVTVVVGATGGDTGELGPRVSETTLEGSPATLTAWTIGDSAEDPPMPPAVSIRVDVDPAPSGWFTRQPVLTLDAVILDVVSDSSEICIETRIDDGDWRPYDGPFALGAEGVHTVTARATGGDGRCGYASRDLSIDTAPPEVRVRLKELGSSVEVTFFADDDVSGVERIQWEGPGTFWGTFQEAFVRALTDEEQVLEYAATDRAGNEGPRQRLTLPSAATVLERHG